MAHRRDDDLIDEQADDDRGRAEQDVVDEPNDEGELGVAAVFGQIGARQQCRAACRSTTPMTVMIKLPAIALSRPPALPGGGVIWVKTASESPAKPFQNSTAEDQDQPGQAEAGGGDAEAHPQTNCGAAARGRTT